MELTSDHLSKSYNPSPEKSPSRNNNSSLLMRKISSAKYKLTKSTESNSFENSQPNMCKFHARIMKFRRKMVCNCNAQGPKIFNSVSEMSRSEEANAFCTKCNKPTQMLASSCTQTALKQCYMVDKLYNDAVVHESFGARFLGHESLPNAVMRDPKRNSVIKSLMKKYEKGPKEHFTPQNVFLSIEGESFIVTNVVSKETMFAHSLDNLPLWSVGGNKNKLLALVQHQTSSRNNSYRNSKVGTSEKEEVKEKVSVKGSLSSSSEHSQYSYTVYLFKCDGDAKGVAEALQKCCMNTRKAIRTSACNTPRAVHTGGSGGSGNFGGTVGRGSNRQRGGGDIPSITVSDQINRRSMPENSSPNNSDTGLDSAELKPDSTPNLQQRQDKSRNVSEASDTYHTDDSSQHGDSTQVLRGITVRSSLNEIESKSKSDLGKHSAPLRSATFSQTSNSAHKRQRSMKETYEVQYNGYVAATKSEGLDVTNAAIIQLDKVLHNVRLTITPASITMRMMKEKTESSPKAEAVGELIAECKLRYLTFYAIGKDISKFAFICANPEEQIAQRCYVITCESGAGRLAQSIERACKTRIHHAKLFSSFGKHGKFFSRGGASSDKKKLENLAQKEDKISEQPETAVTENIEGTENEFL
ncbi:uncharacterized protein LOC142348843 isoform X2 [Convolutriloba macropyga]